MATAEFVLSRRLRASPFEPRVLEHGAKIFTLYNKMTLPMEYESLQADYEHLKQHVQIWDVACERQVEAVGPDAHALMELVTPRDLSKIAVGQGMYTPLVDEFGGIVNDPIILRIADDRFWVSIADSDVLLWLKGIGKWWALALVGLHLNLELFSRVDWWQMMMIPLLLVFLPAPWMCALLRAPRSLGVGVLRRSSS